MALQAELLAHSDLGRGVCKNVYIAMHYNVFKHIGAKLQNISVTISRVVICIC